MSKRDHIFGKKKSVIVLIDPDKTNEQSLAKLRAYDELPLCWFVGGSLLMETKFKETVHYLKKHSKRPVIIFPGNNLQLSRDADAVLFLSLVSGRNPEYLIGQHVVAAPKIKAMELATVSTAYILIDGGRETAVSYISNTKPIPRDKPEIAVATALAAEMQGKELIYLEAGSGAQHSVPSETVKMVKESVDIPVIAGGGVRDIDVVKELLEAGADHVVVGNHLETNPEFLKELATVFRD